MVNLIRLLIAIAGSFAAFNQAQAAGWQLDANNSALHIFSSALADNEQLLLQSSSFAEISGSIDSRGQVRLSLGASSYSSGSIISDQQTLANLLIPAQYPEVSIETFLSFADLEQLLTRQQVELQLAANVKFLGIENIVTLKLRVVQLLSGALLVFSSAPVEFDLLNFDTSDALVNLANKVNLGGINNSVFITFYLQFNQDSEQQ